MLFEISSWRLTPVAGDDLGSSSVPWESMLRLGWKDAAGTSTFVIIHMYTSCSNLPLLFRVFLSPCSLPVPRLLYAVDFCTSSVTFCSIDLSSRPFSGTFVSFP